MAAEDAALLGQTTVPLVRRLLYGFLHREGVRRGDAENMRWRQLDLELGTLRIEVDKTKHSRLFSLTPGVVRALRAWRELKGSVAPNDLVMTDIEGKLPAMDHLADQLRQDLRSAGVTRRELFEADGGWGRLNVHTLRHSFVTRSLALGVSEDTVRQHTGHRSGELQRYRESAKSAADLALKELTPLDEAIPEFVKLGQKLGHELGQTEKRVPEIERVNVRNSSVLN